MRVSGKKRERPLEPRLSAAVNAAEDGVTPVETSRVAPGDEGGRTQYVVAYDSRDGSMTVENLGGISWHDCPPPPKRHKHWAQTRAWTGYFNYTERCACGAFGPKPWHFLGRDKPRVVESPALIPLAFLACIFGRRPYR